jgi:hypothetical protein
MIRCLPNLVQHQLRLLQLLKESPGLLVVRTDKYLGPAIVNRPTYVHKAFTDHLLDTATYQSLSYPEAHEAISKLRSKIFDLIRVFLEEDITNGLAGFFCIGMENAFFVHCQW